MSSIFSFFFKFPVVFMLHHITCDSKEKASSVRIFCPRFFLLLLFKDSRFNAKEKPSDQETSGNLGGVSYMKVIETYVSNCIEANVNANNLLCVNIGRTSGHIVSHLHWVQFSVFRQTQAFFSCRLFYWCSAFCQYDGLSSMLETNQSRKKVPLGFHHLLASVRSSRSGYEVPVSVFLVSVLQNPCWEVLSARYEYKWGRVDSGGFSKHDCCSFWP